MVLEAQIDELTALQAIYGEDCDVNTQATSPAVQVYVPGKDGPGPWVVTALLPATYPASAPPLPQLEGPGLGAGERAALARSLEALFTPGEPVLHSWVEFLREEHASRHPEQDEAVPAGEAAGGSAQADTAQAAEARIRKDSPGQRSSAAHQEGHARHALASLQEPEGDGESAAGGGMARGEAAEPRRKDANGQGPTVSLISGEPFCESRSTFQAHLAPVRCRADVTAVLEALLQSSKIQRATHSIMAYRLVDSETGALHQDYDDDGEQAAGGRLLHLLQLVDARGVVVVVSRWFGGTLLGPRRFALITNAARQLLEQQGYVAEGRKGKGRKK